MSCASAKAPVSLFLPKNAEPPPVPALCDAETAKLAPYAIVENKLEFDDETNDDDIIVLTPPIKLPVICLDVLLFCEPLANILCVPPKKALFETVSVLAAIPEELTALLTFTVALL